VQDGQQQAYALQDPAEHVFSDLSQMQASVNYPNHPGCDPANTAEYGEYPVQYTCGTDFPAGYAPYVSDLAQGYNYGASEIYIPPSSYRMLTALIAFDRILNNMPSPAILGSLDRTPVSRSGILSRELSSPTCCWVADDQANGPRAPSRRHSHQV
jgi:hypothetical protein